MGITFDISTTNTAQTVMSAMELEIDLLSNPDIEFHRKTIHDWLFKEAEIDLSVSDPTDLHSGYNILDQLEKARALEGFDRKEAIFKAYRKAQMLRYGRWSRGEIKSKKEPMPEDVKEMLRAKARPAVKDAAMVKSLAKTSAHIFKESDEKLNEIFYAVFGPQPRNYGREVKERYLYEVMMEFLDDAKKRQIQHLLEDRKAAKEAKPKGRVALHQDKAAQAEKEKAYPWIKPGSWRQDPEKPSSTILEIICQKCQAERTIHAADAFQTKLCLPCKKKSRSAVGQDVPKGEQP